MATSNVDFFSPTDHHQLGALNLTLEVLASAPSSPAAGRMYYDSTLNQARIYTGSGWIAVQTPVTAVTASAPLSSSGGTTPNLTISAATSGAAGSMSAADKAKLDAATATNTATTIVSRDASGDFAANVGTFATARATNAPSGGTDLCNKTYVDALANNKDQKDSVRVASTANVNTASAPAAIDGVTLANGNRVLLKNQTTASQNGTYVFNGSGSAMTRSTDADSSAEVTNGLSVWVAEGTANANTYWVLTTPDPITLGTTSLTFTQFGAGTAYTNGTGITISGSTISIDTAWPGQAAITTVGTIGTGTWNATIIGLTKGGTGADASTTAGKLTARQNLNAVGKYTTTIGDGSATTFTITQATHGLASDSSIDVIVQDVTTHDRVYVGVSVNHTNGTVTIKFAAAPASGAYRVHLLG